MTRMLSLLLILALAGCGQQRSAAVAAGDGGAADAGSTDELQTTPDDIAPMTVTIRNDRQKTIYVDGLWALPFGLQDATGKRLEPASGSNLIKGTCERCDEVCGGTLPHGEPMPCYLELAPSAEYTVSWSASYFAQGSCSACDKSCSTIDSLQPGQKYKVVVPYRLDLDQEGRTFTQGERSCGKAQVPNWRASGIGTPVFDHQAELAVTYTAQKTLLLTIDAQTSALCAGGCPAGQSCIEHAWAGHPEPAACYTKCKTDAECPAGKVCNTPPLVPDTIPYICADPR